MNYRLELKSYNNILKYFDDSIYSYYMYIYKSIIILIRFSKNDKIASLFWFKYSNKILKVFIYFFNLLMY